MMAVSYIQYRSFFSTESSGSSYVVYIQASQSSPTATSVWGVGIHIHNPYPNGFVAIANGNPLTDEWYPQASYNWDVSFRAVWEVGSCVSLLWLCYDNGSIVTAALAPTDRCHPATNTFHT